MLVAKEKVKKGHSSGHGAFNNKNVWYGIVKAEVAHLVNYVAFHVLFILAMTSSNK